MLKRIRKEVIKIHDDLKVLEAIGCTAFDETSKNYKIDINQSLKDIDDMIQHEIENENIIWVLIKNYDVQQITMETIAYFKNYPSFQQIATAIQSPYDTIDDLSRNNQQQITQLLTLDKNLAPLDQSTTAYILGFTYELTAIKLK